MRGYIGWLRKDRFSDEAYDRSRAELELAQYRFIVDNRAVIDERGWIVQGDERHFTGDTVSGWSRQYEYAYAAANIDPDDRKILDVGSGYTFFASWLAKRGHQVTCSDLYDLSALYEKSDIEFVRDDICKTGIREQFDCIYCISVLEHIPDKERAVENMLKLLKPDGKLVLTLDCALNRFPGDTPSVEHLYLLINKINESFQTPPEQICFSRTGDMVTTESFQSHEFWRLPWQGTEAASPLGRLKRLVRRSLPAPRPLIGVFLGTWQRPRPAVPDTGEPPSSERP
jgi:2-polyprenyl-3-methyl-5-hydroxy-6-metoxy-1,4-benzoquinol methylase